MFRFGGPVDRHLRISMLLEMHCLERGIRHSILSGRRVRLWHGIQLALNVRSSLSQLPDFPNEPLKLFLRVGARS
jgi:hypothetical protein